MKSQMSYFGLLALTMVSLSGFDASAESRDVRPRNSRDRKYVQVRLTGPANNQSVSFRLCNRDTGRCQQIGRQASYTLESLRDERRSHFFRSVGAVATDVTLVGGLSIAAARIGGAIATAGVTGTGNMILSSQIGNAAGSGLGAIAGVGLVAANEALNPVLHHQRGRALREEVVTDQDVVLPENQSILAFADRLSEALDGIDVNEAEPQSRHIANRSDSPQRFSELSPLPSFSAFSVQKLLDQSTAR